MRRRFSQIRQAVIKLLVELDVLGLTETAPLILQHVTNQFPESQAWRFRTNKEKLESFKLWLQNEIDENILSVDVKGKPWTAKYIDSAYRKGVVRSYAEIHPEAMAESVEFYRGRRQQFLESSFAQGERLSKLQLLYTRSLEELKGISAAMSQQLGRILADGLANGTGARTIARQMSQSITGITRQRALALARTEIVYAHAEGQLDAFEELGVQQIKVLAEWSTAGDDIVCPMCAPLDGAIMTIKQARGLIPRHPNCRCAWIPADVGERSKKRIRLLKDRTTGKVKRSLKAELPKKTRAGEKVPQTVKEAKRRSTWAGKEKNI
jgi:SPP1 gp7 family putative phage head morphogenesis protein